MNNKKTALIIIIFTAGFMLITALLSIAGHIPFLGKTLSLIIAALMIIFVLIFVLLIKQK